MPNERNRKKLPIEDILNQLRLSVQGMPEPVSFVLMEKFGRDPFILLISCIISLRTKDAVTLKSSLNLFEIASTPQVMIGLSENEIAELIYPAGFYKRKAVQIKKISSLLLEKYQGKVPHTTDELLNLPGVGIKTTSLVLSLAFQIPALCVDVHVHRIANRLGWVTTKTPEETEKELKKIVPQENWIELNRLLVMWGQNICVPISPRCSRCSIAQWCPRKGVKKSR